MEPGYDRAEREKRVLAELAEEFPGLDVHWVPGIGWESYPRGTVVTRALDIDGLAKKLRKRRDEGEPGTVAP
jgi:hypothetical protein